MPAEDAREVALARRLSLRVARIHRRPIGHGAALKIVACKRGPAARAKLSLRGLETAARGSPAAVGDHSAQGCPGESWGR